MYCPHDVTISCENHFNRDSLHLFGLPTYSDNCNVTMEEVDSFTLTNAEQVILIVILLHLIHLE
ncbi:MAG: hypothetical protein IPJ43_05755 [Saprospiraceae bacterium]|nr:hypothetical protein [Saprospiraceae bacterium]